MTPSLHNRILALLALSLVLAVSNAFAQERKVYQTGICPQELGYLKPPCEDFKLEGTIGQSQVAMSLTECQDGLVGLYYYTRYLTPLYLTGQKTKSGLIQLTEKSAENETGTISGRLLDGNFVGQWTGPNGRKSLDLSLKKRIGDMCDLKGPVKTFSDPRWPITFDYPASLSLSFDGNTIFLECIDPQLMRFQQVGLLISKSRSDSPDAPYLKCGQRWFVAASDCSCQKASTNCTRASVSSRHGLTRLEGERTEFRSYCAQGGYVGQSYGATATILTRNTIIGVSAQATLSKAVPALIESMRPVPSTGK